MVGVGACVAQKPQHTELLRQKKHRHHAKAKAKRASATTAEDTSGCVKHMCYTEKATEAHVYHGTSPCGGQPWALGQPACCGGSDRWVGRGVPWVVEGTARTWVEISMGAGSGGGARTRRHVPNCGGHSRRRLRSAGKPITIQAAAGGASRASHR